MAVLGAVFLQPGLIPLVHSALKPFGQSSFYDPRHKVIWASMSSAYEDGEPIDPVIVAGRMPALGWPKDGGYPLVALAELTSSVPTSANVQHYLAVVLRAAGLRDAIRGCQSYVDTAELNGSSTLGGIAELRSTLDLAHKNAVAVRMAAEAVKDSAEEFLAKVREVMAGRLDLRDLRLGIPDVDRIVGGFGRGNLAIVAARPGIGKTTLACNMAVNEARRGKSVVFYSFEMSREELLLRLSAIDGVYDMNSVGPGGDGPAYTRVEQAMGRLSRMPLYIVESLRPMIETLDVSLREHSAAHGRPDIVVVDYLQLMYSSRKTDNRNGEVSLISRRLKELAREHNCLVVAISQLRRADTASPKLEHLRDSGAIEQDADSVLFMSYNSHRSQHEIVLDVDVAKNRHGETGQCQIKFLRGKQIMCSTYSYPTAPAHEPVEEQQDYVRPERREEMGASIPAGQPELPTELPPPSEGNPDAEGHRTVQADGTAMAVQGTKAPRRPRFEFTFDEDEPEIPF